MATPDNAIATDAPRAGGYFPLVDIWRGFAALSVLIYHIIELWQWQSFPQHGPLSWFRIGWLGVDLFFVISGFVVGLSALEEIDRSGHHGFRQPFFRRRLARIVPLHYLTALVFVALYLSPGQGGATWDNIVARLLFIHNLLPQWQAGQDGAMAINPPNWTLAAEMQFYILMLWLAPRLHRQQGWRWLALLVAVAWLWRYAMCIGAWPVLPTPAASLQMLTTQLPGTLDEFVAGLLLAGLVRSSWGARFLQYAGRQPLIWLGLVLAAAALFQAALAIYRPEIGFWQSTATVVWIRTPLAIAAALLVLLACVLNSRRAIYWTTPLRYLGKISYGIYLWQMLVLLALQNWGRQHHLTGALAATATTVALAALSWHGLEKPVLDRFRIRPAPLPRH